MEKTRREFVKLMGGAAVGAGAVLASGKKVYAQAKPAKGVPSEPVKMGVLPILTGIAGVSGVVGLRTTEMWVEKTNAEGGILGRKCELLVEEETSPKEVVEKFRKLTLQNKADVILGSISTAVGLAVGPVAEELQQLWLTWDSTTQKGVEETMPNPKYAFKSADNEMEAVACAYMTMKYYPNVRTVAGINDDYSYGRDCWEAYTTVLKQFNPNIRTVLDLWPKVGESEYTSHIAALKKANPDIVMSQFWSGHMTVFMKQAFGAGLFKTAKGCFTTGGTVFYTLKKEFTPEGLILGYNPLYFDWTDSWPLLKWFRKAYFAKYKDWAGYEADHAWFVCEAYKAAVEKCYAITGTWPTKEQISHALRGIEVQSISGYRGYTQDNRMRVNYFMGITTHKNSFDFITCNPVEIFTPEQCMKPSANMKFHDWVKSWKAN